MNDDKQDKTAFFHEYYAIARDIKDSSNQFFVTNLQRWLDTLDYNDKISQVVNSLEETITFDRWLEKYTTAPKQIGLGHIHWPAGRENYLGAHLALFRAMARREVEVFQFSRTFISSSEDIDSLVREFVRSVFDPMASDLSRYLSREWDRIPQQRAPTADGFVLLDHNSPDSSKAMQALEEVENVVRGTNDYDDPDDKEQRLAELGAGRRLLEATRVRIGALKAVLYDVLKYLAKKFAENAIGVAAKAALGLIGKATGLW